MSNSKEKKLVNQIQIEDSSLKPFIHESHKRPRTRREFMAYGFYGASSTIILPSFASMVMGQSEAYAETVACELPQFSAGVPYLCIDVGGGMNIAGANVMVGMSAGGEFQEDYGSSSSDYVRLGIVPAEAPSVNPATKVESKYGLKFHRASGILAGLNQILDGENMPNGRAVSDGIDGLIFCTRTADDTATNQLNSIYMANKAGAQGELVQLVGNNATDTGARSAAPGGEVNLNIRPSNVARHSDAEGLLSLGSTLSGSDFLNSSDGNAGKERIQKFMNRISKMSKSKIADLSKKNSMGQIKDVLKCSSESAKQLFGQYSAEALNPDNDADVTSVFSGADEKIASVAKLVLDSIAGAGSITIGGGDYHGGTAVNTHAKDMEVGRAIGKSILLARRKEKNLVIHLYTDGGVSGDAGGVSEPVETLGVGNGNIVEKVKWAGDSGTRSSAVLLVYKHNHNPSTQTSIVRQKNGTGRRQVGNFVKNGGVNLNTIIGNNTENLWKAIMINYLAAQGKEGEFENIFGRGSLPTGYESLIRLNKIV